MKKKCISRTNGFIRFKNGIEINYSLYEWALPFSLDLTEYLVSIRILCVSFIFPKKKRK